MSQVVRFGQVTQGASAAGAGASKFLKKGEILFNEGEGSRAMYLIKQGTLRLFKKKGNTSIELTTVTSGQILGELAFLDGNPRSASAEALSDVELVEISGPAFQKTLETMPEWVKILLKTVVGRLRTASNRIRQLETSSVSYVSHDVNGKRNTSPEYVYLSISDVFKILSTLILVASRFGIKTDDGVVSVGSIRLEKYGNQILGIPVSKLTCVVGLLEQISLCNSLASVDGLSYSIKSLDQIEEILFYMNEENILEATKRHDISDRGFVVMSTILKYNQDFKKDPNTGRFVFNLGLMIKKEAEKLGRPPFAAGDAEELVTLGYLSRLDVKGNLDVETSLLGPEFSKAFRVQKFIKALEELNKQKALTNRTGAVR